MNAVTIEPVRLSVSVPLDPAAAFSLFASRIGEWWPVETYSVGEAEVATVVFEERAGGTVYEVWRDGTRRDWADVLVWDPPRRLVLAWRPNPDRIAPTEVEVAFTAEAGGTRIAVEHRGWERLAAEGAAARAGYAGGWPTVLARFQAAAS